MTARAIRWALRHPVAALDRRRSRNVPAEDQPRGGKTNMVQEILDALAGNPNYVAFVIDPLPEWEAARVRAAAGASLFDDFRPGWAERFDVGRLDVADAYRCPLAQMAALIDDVPDDVMGLNPFMVGATVLARATADGAVETYWLGTYGFDSDWAYERDVQVTCGALTTAWRAEILRRRAPVPAVTS